MTTKRLLVYFPALATFYWTDSLDVAKTIIAAHWSVLGEVSDGEKVVYRHAEHDVATISAARRAMDRDAHLWSQSNPGFLCV